VRVRLSLRHNTVPATTQRIRPRPHDFGRSSARKGQRRYDADRSKGVTLGTIRVPGYVTMGGADGARGLSGCLSVHVLTLPRVDALMAGEFTVLATDSGPTSDR